MISYTEILEENNNKILLHNQKFFKKIFVKLLFNFNNFQLQSFTDYYLKKKKINANFLNSEFDQIIQQINQIKLKDNLNTLIVGNDYNLVYQEENFNLQHYADNIFMQISSLIKLKNKKPELEIIFFNLPSMFYQYSQDEKFYEKMSFINKINLEIKRKCDQSKIYLLDYNSIILKLGQNNFYSFKNYYTSKSLFTEKASNFVALEISKIISSQIFTRKKCLVLDLDNTLWGGILGEDGIHGIKIGNSFEGEKFLSFQKYVKFLLKKGIILAIASKNNISDVKKCFKENKNLFLKLSDFSVIKANWSPKYKNINLIANELNIGKDSIVFFDDSKFERDQMQKFNPDVNTINVPDNVKDFIESIEETAFFRSTNDLTKEDKKKKYQYDIAIKANSLKKKYKDGDNTKFLKSLKMILTIQEVNKSNFIRCVQMLNKTNQFNFTTNRYTESTFQNYIKKNKIFSLVIGLEDKFGNHGITGLLTGKLTFKKCTIENFLLSCRILGRGVEDVIFDELIKKLKKMKIEKLIGLYKKTDKNIQCSDFYFKKGFTKISKDKNELCLRGVKKLKNQIMKVVYEKD